MKKTKVNIFAIMSGYKQNERDIKQVFTAKNYDEAKLYFLGYITGEKNPEKYVLYKIAEWTNSGIEQKMIFITGGYEIQNRKYKQEKLIETKNKYDEILQKEMEQTEIIMKLFGGNYVK